MEPHRYHKEGKNQPFIIRHWFGIIASILIISIAIVGIYTIYYVSENHTVRGVPSSFSARIRRQLLL